MRSTFLRSHPSLPRSWACRCLLVGAAELLRLPAISIPCCEAQASWATAGLRIGITPLKLEVSPTLWSIDHA